MKKFAAVGRCLGSKNSEYFFEFTGSYAGYQIKKIKVCLPLKQKFVQNRTYLLWLYLVAIDGDIINSLLEQSMDLDYE